MKTAYSTGLPLPEALQRFETVDLSKPLTDADLGKLFGCSDVKAALCDLLAPHEDNAVTSTGRGVQVDTLSEGAA